ncbi:S-adenosyl-L-methionine-dependent 2-deoxy-scyllo-inosamine dehydrogenase [Lachnospiraceae bacterium]|nr:S-adenosyl-L-methionine-dependent 2-deoxy-scyllo-inosamine dehydrogenase [Lachnospiraceae bacterium]GFI69583.1 S-adenosyl-L-methionine-dependent 2-deoxy-scyllo-inosamine dehydrogenase [Lachnospiraceae bacterium]
MIVNQYKIKSEMNFDETPIWLYILWKIGFTCNKCFPNEKYALYEKWILKKYRQLILAKETDCYLKKYYDKRSLPMFTSIEIEVINRCNGECPFCPVNRYADIRKLKKMDEKLFFKIINELGEMNYTGRLALHSNNEPLLDSRIIDFAKYAREKVPNAYIYMYTNGTLLTLDKFKIIISLLDKIIIDNYNDELEMHKNVQDIHNYCKQNKNIDRKVEIHLRKIHEVLSTRGGQSPNNNRRKTIKMSCILPYKQMVVRPDGKISLCCNDAYGKNTMADLNRMTLKEAWYSAQYERARKLLRSGRTQIRLCKYCDTMPNPKTY